MAVTTSILPADLGSLSLRSPLRQKSITPTTPTHTIRRKGSFIRLPDSSEELPSSHESIFEAFCFSSESSHSEVVELPSRIPRPARRNDENSRDVSIFPKNTIDTVQFRYGNGTALDTIIEKKSFISIRSKARTKSADNSPSVPFLGHRDSFIIARTPRRQISFSLDDIEDIKRSYHDACAVIEDTCRPYFVEEIYAEPKVPVQAPPDRPPTPPGMPSWTEAQTLAVPRRRPSQPAQAPRQNMVKRFFNLSSSTPTTRDHGSTERNRTVSAPVRGRTAPRFRPPKSVYGPIDQHPFAKAPVAKTPPDNPSAMPKQRKRLQKEQRVRFTPSATARDSEANLLQAAIELTSAAAPSPFQPFPVASAPTRTSTKEACQHRKPSGSILPADKSKFASSIAYSPLIPEQRRTSGPALLVKHQPRVTTDIEYSTLPSPTPYHRDEEISSWSPLGPPSRPSSPLIPTQAQLDSLCVLDSPRTGDLPSSPSSTTYLMSGALRAPTPPPAFELPKPKHDTWCWKCTIQNAFAKLDAWWMRSAGFVCFVCCGFDIDEDGTVAGGSGSGKIHPYTATLRGGYGGEMTGPRRVVLNQTPAVML